MSSRRKNKKKSISSNHSHSFTSKFNINDYKLSYNNKKASKVISTLEKIPSPRKTSNEISMEYKKKKNNRNRLVRYNHI